MTCDILHIACTYCTSPTVGDPVRWRNVGREQRATAALWFSMSSVVYREAGGGYL